MQSVVGAMRLGLALAVILAFGCQSDVADELDLDGAAHDHRDEAYALAELIRQEIDGWHSGFSQDSLQPSLEERIEAALQHAAFPSLRQLHVESRWIGKLVEPELSAFRGGLLIRLIERSSTISLGLLFERRQRYGAHASLQKFSKDSAPTANFYPYAYVRTIEFAWDHFYREGKDSPLAPMLWELFADVNPLPGTCEHQLRARSIQGESRCFEAIADQYCSIGDDGGSSVCLGQHRVYDWNTQWWPVGPTYNVNGNIECDLCMLRNPHVVDESYWIARYGSDAFTSNYMRLEFGGAKPEFASATSCVRSGQTKQGGVELQCDGQQGLTLTGCIEPSSGSELILLSGNWRNVEGRDFDRSYCAKMFSDPSASLQCGGASCIYIRARNEDGLYVGSATFYNHAVLNGVYPIELQRIGTAQELAQGSVSFPYQ